MDPQSRTTGVIAFVVVLLLLTCGLCAVLLLNQTPESVSEPTTQRQTRTPTTRQTYIVQPPSPTPAELPLPEIK